MERKSFLAIIENTGNYKIVLGYSGSMLATQFIVIEYTDQGELVRFYDSSNYDTEENYKILKDEGLIDVSPNKLIEFSGNDKLKHLLQYYKEQSSDYEHTLNCSCPACNYCKFTIYRGDTIERVLADFSIIK